MPVVSFCLFERSSDGGVIILINVNILHWHLVIFSDRFYLFSNVHTVLVAS